MDISDSISLLKLVSQSSLKRKALLGGVVGLALVSAELHNNYVSRAYRLFRRSVSAAVAAWLEGQGGFPLFTIEGDEPEAVTPKWDLPSSVSTRRSVLGEGSEQPDADVPASSSVGSFSGQGSRQTATSDLPNFFATTKFFSCLDLKESQELFEATQMVNVAPHEMLFQTGESSDPGIFIVLEGQLGVFLPEGDQLRHTNTLRTGESVGDLDVLDGARRSVTCVALDEGAVLVQVSRELFMRFIAAKPRTLQIYLHKAIARLWRVAHFVLSDFLNLSLEQASSNKPSGTSDSNSMAQLHMPEGMAVRPGMEQPTNGESNSRSTSKPIPAKKAASAEPAEEPYAEVEGQRPETASKAQAHGSALRRGVRFSPALAAVSEGTHDGDSERSASTDSHITESPFAAWTDRGSQDAGPSGRSDPTPRAHLTASMRGLPQKIQESPFATMSQQPSQGSSRASSQDSVEGPLDGTNRLSQVQAGEVSAADAEPSGDSDIASRVQHALTSLRAASLPAALVRQPRPSEPASVADIQGTSPTSPHVGSDASLFARSMSTKASLHNDAQACLASGWDVISPEEGQLSSMLWQRLQAGGKGAGMKLTLRRGEVLHVKDQPCRQFQILLDGHLLAERKKKGGQTESGLVASGSLLGCASFLSSSRNRESVRAAQTCTLAVFAPQELDALLKRSSDGFVELLLAASRALGPVIRRFFTLGLNRVWLDAGDAAYRQGETAEALYVIISGRLRLVREDPGMRPPVRVEEEVGRGEAVGAIWALAGGVHDTTALCVRDCECVRMSRGAFELIVAQCPLAAAGLLSGMGRRMAALSAMRSHRTQYDPSGRAAVATPVPATGATPNGASGGGSAKRGEVVTIALVPAGGFVPQPEIDLPQDRTASPPLAHTCPGASLAVKKLGESLKHTLEELFGPTLHLSSSTLELTFPASFGRLQNAFYRSKVTSWMAAQEEDYRFIIMEADSELTPWSRICVSQADCILLVGAENAGPQVNEMEDSLIWAPMGSSKGERSESRTTSPQPGLQQAQQGYVNAKNWAARMRRVELVLLHLPDKDPKGTSGWLQVRPHLARHHHIRLSHPKDLARLSRWMAGKAVGLVLSGGGSRGLAHLGVLHALDDAGVPVDVIGGTSQGAFMAGLYAQGLAWEEMHRIVRKYARQMGSVRHLLSDLTLPIISVFHGRSFDRAVRETFSLGAQNIEDLWLRFFCMTTNLSKGEPSVHESGILWHLVRASMTIVGLVPPVYHEGDLLVDGGYLNNIPVDVMRGLGVDTVIVVDVEDKDASVWQNLSAFDGGISGFQLLWDRICPFPSLRYGFKLPRYQQIINHLTWMSHAQNLRRVSKEHVIDLYLQPPVGRYRLLDWHLMDVIVTRANRYAWSAISEWQCNQGVTQQGMIGSKPLKEAATVRMRRAHSIPCMTQLQIKQSAAYGGEDDQDYDADTLDTLRSATMQPPSRASRAVGGRRSLDGIPESAAGAAGSEATTSRASSIASMPARDFTDRPIGLFQIVGPVAVPSATDLEALDAADPRHTIETLPSRRSLQRHASQLSAALSAEGLGSRRPSLEAQLRPIDSRTVQSWLPGGIQSRPNNDAGIPKLPPISTANARLSASAPSAMPLWPPGFGEGGALALPNQGILPEDSRPSHVIPEMRRPSLIEDSSFAPGVSPTHRGLSSHPSFTERPRRSPLSDDDLDVMAAALSQSLGDSDSPASSGAASEPARPKQAGSSSHGSAPRRQGRGRVASSPQLSTET